MSRHKSILIALATFAAGVFFVSGTALADVDSAIKEKNAAVAPVPIKTEILIPTPIAQKAEDYSEGKVADVANYIGVVYNFLISIIGLVAAVMMIIGGFQYLTSAGDSGRIGAAKKRITDALVGLVLAFSAYALLNTINPALLQFKPLYGDIGIVNTELALLPWCNDISAKGIAVTQTAGTDCGNIGKYTQDKQELVCMYQGDCRIKLVPPKSLTATCLQRAGLTPKNVIDTLKTDPGKKFALCVPCANITKSVARGLGYDPETACFAWMKIANEQTRDGDNKSNKQFWSYCGLAEQQPGCVQADIDCHAVNNNTPDALLAHCSKDYTCGCGGYDESPEPNYPTQDISYEAVAGGTAGDGWHGYNNELEELTIHLGAVCAINPCENYKDPESKQQSFVNGCSGIGGSKYAPGVRIFTSDCRNK